MTKEKYMALADVQSLWTNRIKPHISQTYATKSEVTQASTQTCQNIVTELT